MAKLSKKLPTKQEISELPCRAIVAFAARCARRVQPIFELTWPDAPKKYKEAVANAIQFAEAKASKGTFDAARAHRAADAAADAAKAVRATYYAAKTAIHAARTALTADTFGYADAWSYTEVCVASANEAEKSAFAALYSAKAGNIAESECAFYIKADLEKLKQAAKKEHWTNETPVLPEFFGPLWPDGEPDWQSMLRYKPQTKKDQQSLEQLIDEWMALEQRIGTIHNDFRSIKDEQEKYHEQPLIKLYIDPGDASEEDIQEVLEALSDLHIAAEGLGLEFVNDANFLYAAAEVTP